MSCSNSWRQQQLWTLTNAASHSLMTSANTINMHLHSLMVSHTHGLHHCRYCPNVTFGSDKAALSLQHLASTGANYVSIVVTQYMVRLQWQCTVRMAFFAHTLLSQDKFNSTQVYPLYVPVYSSYYTYITATDGDLETVIRRAHALGLKVMLKLQVQYSTGTPRATAMLIVRRPSQIDLTDDPKHWRGDIGSGFTTDAEVCLCVGRKLPTSPPSSHTLLPPPSPLPPQWEAWFASYGSALLHYTHMAVALDVEQLSMSCELISASPQVQQ